MTDAPSELLVAFALTVALCFLLGLALREYYIAQEQVDYFGSVRTYTFIGMLGFGLFYVQPEVAYPLGIAALAIFLTVYYRHKIDTGKPGMIGMLTALLAYLVGPLALKAPTWFVILFVVSMLFAVSAKERIRILSERISQRELVTLGTFLTLAGVILPLLPHATIASFVPLTPYQVWLAVVVSTGVSYGSYLLQKYAFPQKGLLLTGFLGGLYSSTASTFVIARRSHSAGIGSKHVAGALIAPTAMMYFRVTALSAVFDPSIALQLAPLFLSLGLAGSAAAWLLGREKLVAPPGGVGLERNPLELSSAALFAALLVAMAIATHFVTAARPGAGLDALAVAAGLSDIDAFIISLLQTRTPLAPGSVAKAIVISTIANNLLKSGYAALFAQPAAAVRAAVVLVALTAAGAAFVVARSW